MQTKFTLLVHYTNGEVGTYKDDAVMTFEMQDRGLLFIHSQLDKNLKQVGNRIQSVKYRYTRTWIPYSQVKSVDVITNKELTDTKEIAKYQEFLKHGIDMMMTPISHTKPKDPKEVETEIAAEKTQNKKPESEAKPETKAAPDIKPQEPKTPPEKPTN